MVDTFSAFFYFGIEKNLNLGVDIYLHHVLPCNHKDNKPHGNTPDALPRMVASIGKGKEGREPDLKKRREQNEESRTDGNQ